MMRASALTVASALCFAAVGPASAESILSYSTAVIIKRQAQGHSFNVSVHPKADKLLVQPSWGEIGKFGRIDEWPEPLWREVAADFVAPIGCSVSTVDAKSLKGGTWEATIACPAGTDLHALVRDQKAALKRGEPLRLPGPA